MSTATARRRDRREKVSVTQISSLPMAEGSPTESLFGRENAERASRLSGVTNQTSAKRASAARSRLIPTLPLRSATAGNRASAPRAPRTAVQHNDTSTSTNTVQHTDTRKSTIVQPVLTTVGGLELPRADQIPLEYKRVILLAQGRELPQQHHRNSGAVASTSAPSKVKRIVERIADEVDFDDDETFLERIDPYVKGFGKTHEEGKLREEELKQELLQLRRVEREKKEKTRGALRGTTSVASPPPPLMAAKATAANQLQAVEDPDFDILGEDRSNQMLHGSSKGSTYQAMRLTGDADFPNSLVGLPENLGDFHTEALKTAPFAHSLGGARSGDGGHTGASDHAFDKSTSVLSAMRRRDRDMRKQDYEDSSLESGDEGRRRWKGANGGSSHSDSELDSDIELELRVGRYDTMGEMDTAELSEAEAYLAEHHQHSSGNTSDDGEYSSDGDDDDDDDDSEASTVERSQLVDASSALGENRRVTTTPVLGVAPVNQRSTVVGSRNGTNTSQSAKGPGDEIVRRVQREMCHVVALFMSGLKLSPATEMLRCACESVVRQLLAVNGLSAVDMGVASILSPTPPASAEHIGLLSGGADEELAERTGSDELFSSSNVVLGNDGSSFKSLLDSASPTAREKARLALLSLNNTERDPSSLILHDVIGMAGTGQLGMKIPTLIVTQPDYSMINTSYLTKMEQYDRDHMHKMARHASDLRPHGVTRIVLMPGCRMRPSITQDSLGYVKGAAYGCAAYAQIGALLLNIPDLCGVVALYKLEVSDPEHVRESDVEKRIADFKRKMAKYKGRRNVHPTMPDDLGGGGGVGLSSSSSPLHASQESAGTFAFTNCARYDMHYNNGGVLPADAGKHPYRFGQQQDSGTKEHRSPHTDHSSTHDTEIEYMQEKYLYFGAHNCSFGIYRRNSQYELVVRTYHAPSVVKLHAWIRTQLLANMPVTVKDIIASPIYLAAQTNAVHCAGAFAARTAECLQMHYTKMNNVYASPVEWPALRDRPLPIAKPDILNRYNCFGPVRADNISDTSSSSTAGKSSSKYGIDLADYLARENGVLDNDESDSDDDDDDDDSDSSGDSSSDDDSSSGEDTSSTDDDGDGGSASDLDKQEESKGYGIPLAEALGLVPRGKSSASKQKKKKHKSKSRRPTAIQMQDPFFAAQYEREQEMRRARRRRKKREKRRRALAESHQAETVPLSETEFALYVGCYGTQSVEGGLIYGLGRSWGYKIILSDRMGGVPGARGMQWSSGPSFSAFPMGVAKACDPSRLSVFNITKQTLLHTRETVITLSTRRYDPHLYRSLYHKHDPRNTETTGILRSLGLRDTNPQYDNVVRALVVSGIDMQRPGLTEILSWERNRQELDLPIDGAICQLITKHMVTLARENTYYRDGQSGMFNLLKPWKKPDCKNPSYVSVSRLLVERVLYHEMEQCVHRVLKLCFVQLSSKRQKELADRSRQNALVREYYVLSARHKERSARARKRTARKRKKLLQQQARLLRQQQQQLQQRQ